MRLSGLSHYFRVDNLSSNGFSATLKPLAHSDLSTVTAPASAGGTAIAGVSRSASVALLRRARAAHAFESLKNSLLEMHPQQWDRLVSASQQARENFLERNAGEDGHSCDVEMDLTASIRTYTMEPGGFILMNAMLQGHKTLEDFISSMGWKPEDEDAGGTIDRQEVIDAYCEGFEERFSVQETTYPGGIPFYFEHALPDETALLKDFLDNGVEFRDVWVAKGIKATSVLNPAFNTSVDPDKLLSSFLEGDLIHYRGFLSTTASLGKSLEFAAISEIGEPLLSYEIQGGTAEELQVRAKLDAMLASGELQEKGIVHIMHLDRAKGVVLQGADPDSPMAEEQEILCTSDHILYPQKLVCFDEAVLLVSRCMHISSLQSPPGTPDWQAVRDAGHVDALYEQEWPLVMDQFAEPFGASRLASGGAFLSQLARGCDAVPGRIVGSKLDIVGTGDDPRQLVLNRGLMSEHRLAIAAGSEPITVLSLRHPFVPGMRLLRRIPEGAGAVEREQIIGDLLARANSIV